MIDLAKPMRISQVRVRKVFFGDREGCKPYKEETDSLALDSQTLQR